MNADATDATPKRSGWKAVFVDSFAKCGIVSAAARVAGISRQHAYRAAKSDTEFAAAWAEAREEAADELEFEARRRAKDGVVRPVYQGGKKVGEVTEYSDTLLIFLLKALRPEVFRDNARVVVAGDQSSPVRHDHSPSVTDKINELAAAFERAADRAGEGGDPGDGAGPTGAAK
jgi:hypothetical protein